MADETEAVVAPTQESLSEVVRDYLKAIYAAAGTQPPELSESEVQAALRRALPETVSEQPSGGGLLAWLTALPGHAVHGLHGVWADWLRRYQETDEVWPMRLVHATEELVGEGVRDLGHQVRDLAVKKMTALEQRYGRVGAITVFGAAVLLTPVPVPGTTLVPVLVAEGVRAVGVVMWSDKPQPEAWGPAGVCVAHACGA
jgi:hypothetical protein